MLRSRIFKEMRLAMKSRDKVRLEALRYLWSLIKNAEIDAKVDLADEQVVRIIQAEVKKRREAVEQMKRAGRGEMVAEEEGKLKVLAEFLPEQMNGEEISRLVDEIMAELGKSDFGEVMREAMKRVDGKADGRRVAEVVKGKFSSASS